MNRLPPRTSLVAQAATVLREAIAAGEWARWLPGELELSRRLSVSRVTLRAALAELEHAKLIRAGQGKRREIVGRRRGKVKTLKSREVALLSPTPLHRLVTSTLFWVDELRKELDAAGWNLDIVESAAAYSRKPQAVLADLEMRMRPAGWVLYRSTPEMQHWFGKEGKAAVLAGSPHPGVELPSVDEDYRAGCRHAAGRFVAAGHRRLAILRPDTALAGDLESVAGFHEGAGTPGSVVTSEHDGSPHGIARSMERVFGRDPKPTGLFVFNAPHLLTALGWLQYRGIRVPKDVSVVCRDDEPFLDYAVPAPARYALNPGAFGRKISKLVVGRLTGEVGRTRQYRLVPNFIRGDSLAAPGS